MCDCIEDTFDLHFKKYSAIYFLDLIFAAVTKQALHVDFIFYFEEEKSFKK